MLINHFYMSCSWRERCKDTLKFLNAKYLYKNSLCLSISCCAYIKNSLSFGLGKYIPALLLEKSRKRSIERAISAVVRSAELLR